MQVYHGWKLGAFLIVGFVAFFWMIKASMIAIYISDKMGIPVTIRWVSVWPTETILHGFRIANPPHFRKVSALRAKRVEMDYQPHQILSNPSEVEQILFDRVTINIELPTLNKSENNWTAIGSGMQKSGKGKGVIVRKLVFTNLTVETLGKGARALGIAGTQQFDRIELDQIDSSQGFPTKELIQEIFGKVGLVNYLEKFVNPTERIRSTLNPFNLFGKSEPPERGLVEKD